MADRGDSGRPSDARREAAANAIDAALKAGVEISPQRLAHLALDAADAVSEPTPRPALDFDETKKAVESMLGAYLPRDPSRVIELTHRLLYDTPLYKVFMEAAPEPLTPPRDALRFSEGERKPGWCDKHDDLAWLYADGSVGCMGALVLETSDADCNARILPVYAERDHAHARAAALEGALRALVAACADWAGDESSDGQPLLPRRVSTAIAKAQTALAESTPD